MEEAGESLSPTRPCAGFSSPEHMNREQKAEVIEQIAAQISGAEAVYAIDYRGLTVTQAAELRSRLREADASFRIVKNTLSLRAADKAGAEALKPLVEQGPTALTFVAGDPALAAKALDVFSRQSQVLELKGGVLAGRTLDVEALRSLARLPGREQLNAQLAGVVASPLTGLVRGLGSLLSGLAIALGQVREQRAAESPEPQAEPQSEPEPKGEAPSDSEPEAVAEEASADQPDSEEQQAEPEPEKEAE
jgi:large subunit ribosomal protein L10